MKKLSKKNVLRNEIPGQMSIEDFPEYLPESYSRGGQMSRAEVRRRKRENEKKVSVGDTGLNSADVYKIRIPDNVGNADLYLPPEEYAALENPSGHWTIQNDDHIVLGVCDLKIERPAELQAIRLLHCKVTSWSDNRFGGLPHWRIGGE